jgi:hypothetical protein
LLATVPIYMYLMLPSPLYWHQNVFFSDQAVMLYVALFVALEVTIYHGSGRTRKKWLNPAQQLLMFMGVLTDWFFIPLVVIVWLKRLVFGQLGNDRGRAMVETLRFVLPALLALGLFAIQLLIQGANLWRLYIARGGFLEDDPYAERFVGLFWRGHMQYAYGWEAIVALWFALITVATAWLYYGIKRIHRRRVDDAVSHIMAVAGMLILPCFLHAYLLRNHSAVHDFSTLKFAASLAVPVFVLLPVAAILFIRRVLFDLGSRIDVLSRLAVQRRFQGLLPVLMSIFLVWFAAGYVNSRHHLYRTYFPEPSSEMVRIGEFINRHTSYRDVVFSDTYEVMENPPQRLAYTDKLVYKVESLDDILRRLEKISSADYRIAFFLYQNRQPAGEDLRRLLAMATRVMQGEDGALYQISAGADFAARARMVSPSWGK